MAAIKMIPGIGPSALTGGTRWLIIIAPLTAAIIIIIVWLGTDNKRSFWL